jgi:hypothetical protein
LDECSESAGSRERSQSLSLLEGVNRRHGSKTHILVTSRPETDIKARLGGHSALNLEDRLEEHVATFARLEFLELDSRIFGPAIRNRIIGELLDLRRCTVSIQLGGKRLLT